MLYNNVCKEGDVELKKIVMELDNPVRIEKTSNLQGILMENIDSEYADLLHEMRMHPYSQHIEKIDAKSYWVVNALNKEAEKCIIDMLYKDDFNKFTFKKNKETIKIISKKFEVLDENELLQNFYQGEVQRYINLEFISPTAFKSNGKYVIMPDTRLIFQNMMNRYTTASETMNMIDTETLEQLDENSSIVNYRLRSISFPMEGIKIPAFIGGITIRVNGPETMVRYANMLSKFSEYSGIGIKTAVGMGAVRIRDWRKKNDRSSN